MLHDIHLAQPCLVEAITRRMHDMTESVLLRKNEHGVEEALHRLGRTDERWSEITITPEIGHEIRMLMVSQKEIRTACEPHQRI